MSKPILTHLTDAIAGQTYVRLTRRFEDSPIHGYALAIGPEFFLFALVNEQIWLDGFECFRIADIKKIKPAPYAAFAEKALELRGERRPGKPRITMDSIESVLHSANRAFPLVTIHLEKADPQVCYIGKVTGISQGKVSLLEIAPSAKWDELPTTYSLRKITRVSFGGDYEDALHLVGGKPPRIPRQDD